MKDEEPRKKMVDKLHSPMLKNQQPRQAEHKTNGRLETVLSRKDLADTLKKRTWMARKKQRTALSVITGETRG